MLAIIAADTLTGQPTPGADALQDALAGRSSIDDAWWKELRHLRTDVIVDQADRVRGVMSFADRPRDDTGVILWLHANEDHDVVLRLLWHALAEFESRTQIHAFDFATALTHGLEALPVRHRATTQRTLVDVGFSSADSWRYMHTHLGQRGSIAAPSSGARRLEVSATRSADDSGWELQAEVDGKPAGEVSLGDLSDGVAPLWWIEVYPEFRGSGLGRRLLAEALEHLRAAGAREVILYVDDDARPGDERDRSAANRLYDSAGFTEVDRLHSYSLRTR